MANRNPEPLADPDDLFADTRMSFGDHIEDLRSHLIRAVVGFVIGIAICVMPPMGPFAVKFITRPVEIQLQQFYDKYEESHLAEAQEKLAATVPPVPVLMKVNVPALRGALGMDGRKPEPIGIIEGVDRVLDDIGFPPPRSSKRDAEEWADVPVKIPDPMSLAKAMMQYQRVARPATLATLSVQEAFLVYVKVGLLFGFVLSSPWVFYQIWSFVAVGLYPHEKRLVNYYLPISLGLFLAGFFVCEFLALPKAIEALLWFNDWLGFRPELRLNEWLGFAILMPLVFGLSFQTPLVMLFLFQIGIADIDTFRSKRRLAWFLMMVFAALITPSTDVPTLALLWVPMCLLYEVGILLCKMQPRTLADDLDNDLDELIGV